MQSQLIYRNTMVFGRVDNIYVVLHNSRPPSDSDWQDWMSDLEPQAKQLTGIFVQTLGGTPSVTQRKVIADMWKRVGRVPPIAVVLTQPIVRVIVTALNYFMSRALRGFSPDSLDKAMDYIAVPKQNRQSLQRLVESALASIEGEASANQLTG